MSGKHAPRPLIICILVAALLLPGALSACTTADKPKTNDNPIAADELLDLGEEYLLDLDYEGAAEQFLRVIEAEPMNARAYTGLAEAYIGQGDTGGAVTALRDGVKLFMANPKFLNDAIAIYEEIIAGEPTNADAYIGLTDAYIALGKEESAVDVLGRGLAQLPDNGQIAELYYSAVIPGYEIRQTLYQEMRADDGVLLARNEFMQPVFVGDSARVRKMNGSFSQDLENVTLDDFAYLPEEYDSREGYTYDEAQQGRVGGYLEIWEESYRIHEYISFVASGDWDGLGAHGGYDLLGRTFNAGTGEILGISDVLTVGPDMQVDVLYSEYIDYQMDIYEGYFADLARGYSYGEYNQYYVDSVKGQCGENAVFWLAVDGIHIFFNQYTFTYADGSSELVIPYTRTDLVRAPFAA